MKSTITVCSLLLTVLGFAMSARLFPNPLAFLPYILFLFAILAAHRLATKAVVLALTLTSVCVGFWYYWDAAFVHLSTMNMMPLEVAIMECLLAGLVLTVTWRIDRKCDQ